MIGSFVSLIFPLGLGLASLLGALVAHRGFPTKGTWTLLISSLVYFVILVAIFGSVALTITPLTPGGSGDFEFMETLMIIFGVLWFLNLIAMSIGAFLMTSGWKHLSQDTQELEVLAQELASEREVLAKDNA